MSDTIPTPEKLALKAVEGPIKQSVGAVFDTLNEKVESLDLSRKYESKQKTHIRIALENIKLLEQLAKVVDGKRRTAAVARWGRFFIESWAAWAE